MTIKEAAFYECAFMILNDQCPPDRKGRLTMYYLKNGKKKLFIEDNNVFTQCPRCGKERQIDLADAVIDGALDL